MMHLLDRTVKAMKLMGYQPYFIQHHINPVMDGVELPDLTISVEETPRRNHSKLDNVTVTIIVNKWYSDRTGKSVFKTKVPANASDKVINNRIAKAIEFMDNAK